MHPSESTKHAAFITDEHGAIITWNIGCEALFGRPAADILRQPIGALLTEPSRAECRRVWADVLPVHCDALQVTLLQPDGSTPETELSLVPQYDAGGTFTGCAAFFDVELDNSEGAVIGRMPLHSVIDVLPGTFHILREDGSFAFWNRTLELVAARTSAEIAQMHALDLFDVTEKHLVEAKIRQVFERGEQVFIEVTLFDKYGKGTPYLVCGGRIDAKDKHYLCGMGFDISKRHAQEQQLRLRERALHATSNGILITRLSGMDNPIEYVNPAFERITGYRCDEVIGRDPRFMAAPGMDEEERKLLREAIGERREINVTFRNVRKNGELFWNDLTITPVADEKGHINHFIGVIIDVTLVKQRTAQLEHEVNHDALTGLANRTLLWDRLEQAIHMAQRNKSLVATVLIDLNGFKQINDTLGHEAGDEVLIVVAKRLQSSVRDSDTVARLSGDEFVLVLVNQPSLRYTLRMIERLRQGMSKPVVFNNTEIEVGASMGVSVFPHDGASAFDLVRAADVAMYHAKATRKSEVYFFSPDMKSTTDAKQKLEDNMRAAVDKGELFLLFQPRICLQKGHIKGFEALLRWNHPEHGLLLPSSFLPEAEENGMIISLGNLVLDQACAFLQRLKNAGFDALPVSVNVSQREYARQQYVQHMADVLSKYALAPASLEVELREEGLVRNHHLGREVMAQLNELGVQRAIDAFGDGLSDLNYLQQLPLSRVKLAKVAVHQISAETRTGPMAKTLIDIGHNLNVSVVAECVETRAQMDFLKANKCDEMQGYYFREPLRAEAIEELLTVAPAA